MNKQDVISILGSGWLGLPLASSLQVSGKTVHLSTRTASKAKQLSDLNFESYIVDIENSANNIQDFLQATTIIINITCKSLSAFEYLVNEIEKSPIEHVLFISSTSVYGNDQGLCKESDILEIETNLRKIEKLFTDNTYFDCAIIRFAGLIGPKRHPGRFFAGGKIIKDGKGKVNLIHQLDCIKLIETVLHQQAWGEIFNGCADNHPTKQSYYTKMALSLGYPEPECVITEQSASKIICNEKIKTQLGYQFIYPDIFHIVC
jgi:nucleoside-diphosphate-sugar epimerase